MTDDEMGRELVEFLRARSNNYLADEIEWMCDNGYGCDEVDAVRISIATFVTQRRFEIEHTANITFGNIRNSSEYYKKWQVDNA